MQVKTIGEYAYTHSQLQSLTANMMQYRVMKIIGNAIKVERENLQTSAIL